MLLTAETGHKVADALELVDDTVAHPADRPARGLDDAGRGARHRGGHRNSENHQDRRRKADASPSKSPADPSGILPMSEPRLGSQKRCCPDVRRSLYDRRTKLIQLRTTSTKQRQSRLKFKGCATPTQERGCRIVDGTGNPWFYADLAIKNGHTPLWRRHEGPVALDQAHGEGLVRDNSQHHHTSSIKCVTRRALAALRCRAVALDQAQRLAAHGSRKP